MNVNMWIEIWMAILKLTTGCRVGRESLMAFLNVIRQKVSWGELGVDDNSLGAAVMDLHKSRIIALH